jgi:hypothetical protein
MFLVVCVQNYNKPDINTRILYITEYERRNIKIAEESVSAYSRARRHVITAC